MPRKWRDKADSLKVVNPDCAGIHIGKDTHDVAVGPDRSPEPVRSFDAFTPDLEEMAAWLSSCGVKKVTMESTSVYWMPVFEVLDRTGFKVKYFWRTCLTRTSPKSATADAPTLFSDQNIHALKFRIASTAILIQDARDAPAASRHISPGDRC
ncbi:MAG: hypothetical protein OXH79_11585 [Boseongicola sp.]|nr:hypothetical protein [Boseongicola sp.]